MKRVNLYGLLLFSTTLLINSGCSQENQILPPVSPTLPAIPQTDPIETVSQAPISSAGQDFQVILPTDFVWLSGSYSDIAAIDNFVWKKISGPSSYIIETPDLLRTKVSKLEKGIYKFELTVTNKSGLTDKDTVRVTVGQMSTNLTEVIFNDMSWTCPWYCQVEIENIYSHLPSGSVFRIYIQRDNSVDWTEVVHENWEVEVHDYAYILYSGNLITYHWGNPEPRDTPNIKIAY